jgi:hypothetical protein
MCTLSLDEIFEKENSCTTAENFVIFKNNFQDESFNFSLPTQSNKLMLNIENFVEIMVKYNMNKNVLDLIDYVESTKNKYFTYWSKEEDSYKFHFSPNMFVRFIELNGTEELLKKIALRTCSTVNNEELFEDILYCSILSGSISNSLILYLFKTNKFITCTKSHKYTLSCTSKCMSTKIAIFMHVRTHILYGIIPEKWKNILHIDDYNYRFNMHIFYDFIFKINPDLNEKICKSDKRTSGHYALMEIGNICKLLMNSTYKVTINRDCSDGYVFPESYFEKPITYYSLTTDIINIVCFCYALCFSLMCENNKQTALLPQSITDTLKNIYKKHPHIATIITEFLIMIFLENDIVFDKNTLLFLSYKIYGDAINLGPIAGELANKKLYNCCEHYFKYFHNYLKSSIYTDIILRKILSDFSSSIDDEKKTQIKSLCIAILETGVKNNEHDEKLLNDIGIISEEIKWSWRWSTSEKFNPNAVNDKHESLFEEAYSKNKHSTLKKILLHRKFRPMTLPNNIVDIVLNDTNVDYKKYILGKLLQTSIILKSEQVKKITEIGIDVYKTLQKRICASDDIILKMEENLDKVCKAFALSEERNDIIQERLRLMEQREYKIISFLQMMCMQYTTGDESSEVSKLLTDIA